MAISTNVMAAVESSFDYFISVSGAESQRTSSRR